MEAQHEGIRSTPKILQTDVLIVGSGPIGATYARTIINEDANIKVLMVEMGEQESRLIGDHKKNNAIVQLEGDRFTRVVQGAFGLLSKPVNPRLSAVESKSGQAPHPEFTLGAENVEQLRYNNLPIAPVVRSVGGMGSYWSCATPEQHPTIERSDIFSDSEWRSLYREAKGMFSITDTAFDHSVRHHVVKDTLSKAHTDREFVNLPLACQRNLSNPDYVQWTCSATILGDIADPRYAGGNFELRSHHCCTGLVVDAASKQVVAAKLTNLMTKELVLVKAKKYAICAGAALGAGILYNSNIRPETGYPALGRYMTEQTMAVCQVIMKDSLVRKTWENPHSKAHFNKYPEDPLHLPFNDPSPQVTTPVSEKYPWHTQIQRDPFHYNKIPTSIDPRLILDLRFFGYVEPVYDNHIEFKSENLDLFGMPQPIVHYRLGKEDAKRARDMVEDMANVASHLGEFLPGGEPRFLEPGAATHICGTTRAGKKDDGHSVVDKYSKVWRLDNLFIGGCGVIPTQNACNPTLTAACFAIKSARKVVEEIHDELRGRHHDRSRL